MLTVDTNQTFRLVNGTPEETNYGVNRVALHGYRYHEDLLGGPAVRMTMSAAVRAFVRPSSLAL